MEANNKTILVDTIIDATPEKLWQAWTDPTLIMMWFGSDPDGEGLKAALDVRPGGFFEVEFMDADLTVHNCSGIYQVVEPYSRLSFTWTWKSELGVESLVVVKLTPLANATHMQLEHINPGSGSVHDYQYGWQATFLKLSKLLSSSAM